MLKPENENHEEMRQGSIAAANIGLIIVLVGRSKID